MMQKQGPGQGWGGGVFGAGVGGGLTGTGGQRCVRLNISHAGLSVPSIALTTPPS